MSEHTQDADWEENNPYRDTSKGACCLGELLIRAEVKLTYPNPKVYRVNFEAKIKRETKTTCVDYGCHDITVGELSPFGPFEINVCEYVASVDNYSSEGGGKKITVYKNGRRIDPTGTIYPDDPGPYLDDEGHIRYRHTVSLGCCEVGCAARFWDGGEGVLYGSVPGRPGPIRRHIGYDLDHGGVPWRPRFITEEGIGFDKDIWNKVADAILAKYGPGGQFPYKFAPCCKKGSSGGDSGDSGGGKG